MRVTEDFDGMRGEIIRKYVYEEVSRLSRGGSICKRAFHIVCR
jgi:hypothetical protein